MKKWMGFGANVLGGWMILIALLMGVVHGVAADDELYFRLQKDAGILASAGISEEDLRVLDARLSDYLFKPMAADAAFDNSEMEVFGELQPPFNERERTHLQDCRKLLSITSTGRNYVLLLAGGAFLLLCNGRKGRLRCGAIWLAAALVLLPIAALGVWAAADFGSAFSFFHELLFTNDLWLLNPETDLLIRICPSSMFARMGLRIALRAGGVLLGIPLVWTLMERWHKRKKERNEIADL